MTLRAGSTREHGSITEWQPCALPLSLASGEGGILAGAKTRSMDAKPRVTVIDRLAPEGDLGGRGQGEFNRAFQWVRV